MASVTDCYIERSVHFLEAPVIARNLGWKVFVIGQFTDFCLRIAFEVLNQCLVCRHQRSNLCDMFEFNESLEILAKWQVCSGHSMHIYPVRSPYRERSYGNN